MMMVSEEREGGREGEEQTSTLVQLTDLLVVSHRLVKLFRLRVAGEPNDDMNELGTFDLI